MAGNNSGYENTWIIDMNLQSESQFVKYLYSFYFCTTTILTVGYGDITPKNHLEVGVVIGVMIFGIYNTIKVLSCSDTSSTKSDIQLTSLEEIDR
jgi:hypothetical protein